MADDGILWDVIDEHLAEIEFSVERWQAALCSPRYALGELAGGPEEQLIAHIDAVALAGKAVVDARLVAALAEPGTALGAALLLLALDRQDLVWAALSAEDPAVRAGAVEAYSLSASPQFDAWLPGQLAPGVPLSSLERVGLLQIAGRRGLPVAHLKVSLQHGGRAEQIAAIVAARRGDPAQVLSVLETLVDHDDPEIREAALVTALQLGSAHAWQRCLARASDVRRVYGQEMLLVALLGEPAQHAVLVERLKLGSHRHAALAALAWSGHADVVAPLLEWTRAEDERTARLAAFAVATICGLDVAERDEDAAPVDALPPLDEDDLDADLVPGAEDELVLPRVDELRAEWERVGGGLDRKRRLLGGQPWTLASALAWLERASMYARGPVALWLLIRSGGAARIEGAAWAASQRVQAERLRGLTEHALTRRFSGW